MRPVTQTRMGKPLGNCTEAAIASILEVGIEEVPDLYDGENEWGSPAHRKAQFQVLHDWLLARFQLKYCQICLPLPEAMPIARHWTGVQFETTHHLLMGYNPDGLGHAVVGLAGEMVWDPNPSRRGIINPDEVVYLLPWQIFGERCREWPGISLTPV